MILTCSPVSIVVVSEVWWSSTNGHLMPSKKFNMVPLSPCKVNTFLNMNINFYVYKLSWYIAALAYAMMLYYCNINYI